MILVRYGGDVT